MKKLSKVLMVGALALTGFAGVGAFEAKPASAAEKVQYAGVYDDWGIYNTRILADWIKPMPDSYKSNLLSSYKTGNYFTITVPDNGLVAGQDQVKIFRVEDNGDLSRYKTIDFRHEWVLPGEAIFDTQITDNYHAGTYVAVSYINGVHLKSDFFTINK